MDIKRVSFINHVTGWLLHDVLFGKFTLLVGASGVGKTQILKSLYSLSSIACGNSLPGEEWHISFCEAGVDYLWEGRFDISATPQNILPFEKSESPILYEKLMADGEVIFSRKGSQILYQGKPTVKLDTSKSAVELLKEESDISIVNQAFKKLQWLDLEEGSRLIIPFNMFEEAVEGKEENPLTLKDIKSLKARTPLVLLSLIKKHDKETFKHIKQVFSNVFPLVEDIDFDFLQFVDNGFIPVLKIKEKGVESWIKQPDISAGMCRTLNQIIALTLSEEGDIILIDEFENGLGINCIDILADMALEPEVNVQIVMTSHHPYIINSIPFKNWRIVSRSGSDVRVSTASDLKIGEHSRHDAFMQLIQTSEYRTGQS